MKKENSYQPLVFSAGMGSVLGSGIIIAISTTITVWQNGLGLTDSQVGIISGVLTFAIAAGSLLAGSISKHFGLIRSFNMLSALFMVGSLICAMAQNFTMLLIGTVLAGFFSGIDLPVSLAVISRDAPDEKTSAELVSATQIYWTVGILLMSACAFLTSSLAGVWSGRITLSVLTLCGLITLLSRNTSSRLKEIHASADAKTVPETDAKPSLTGLLFGKEKKKYLGFFMSILLFYVGWNLLANTFGQFQTFMLVKANATQTFATGAGIVLTIVVLIVAAIFTKIAGGKNRNVAFAIGIVIMVASLIGLANSSSNLLLIVLWLALENIGSTFAGESMYKVWTQESFPTDYRTGVQGFINGFSRLCCALFATVTPMLVLPETIKTTMYCFAVLIAVAGLFGFNQIRLQKKYKVGRN
jgi:inositol transporter-like SP family MFS transporter